MQFLALNRLVKRGVRAFFWKKKAVQKRLAGEPAWVVDHCCFHQLSGDSIMYASRVYETGQKSPESSKLDLALPVLFRHRFAMLGLLRSPTLEACALVVGKRMQRLKWLSQTDNTAQRYSG